MKLLKTICTLLLVFTGNVFATPVVSVSSGNWNNGSTWLGGIIPGAGDIVTIANGHTVTVTANTGCDAVIIGDGLLNQNSILFINPGISLSVAGNITIIPPATGTVDNMLAVNAGFVNCTSVLTSNSSSDNCRTVVNISTGRLTCSGNFILGNNSVRNKLTFSGTGLLQIAGNSSKITNAQFTAASGAVEYNGNTVQYILPLSYHTLKCTGNAVKFLTSHTTLTGDLAIGGAAMLDVSSTNNYHLTVGGNWTVTSSSTYPFLKRKGTVTFNGTTGVQVLTTSSAQETFYNLIVNNTAGNSGADIEFNKNCIVTQAYTHINGNLDLKGKKLVIVSENRQGIFTTCHLSAGKISSTVAGARVTFADAHDSAFVNFTGTVIGDANFPVSLSVSTGRIHLQNLHLHGTGSFTKKHAADDITAGGGNKFYNNVSFTLLGAAGNWYLGAGNGALPDSFFAKVSFTTFAANAGTQLITGANSTGNYYGDNVSFYIKSAGSIFIGNNSGASNGTASTNYFNSLADIWLSGSGSITFSNGQSLLPSTTIFNGLVRAGSTASATGNIFIGKNNAGSSVQLTANSQIMNGFIYGTTSLYLYNIVQTGTLPQIFTNTTTQTNRIIIGGNNGSCTWNGPVTFTASVLDLAYSNFKGNTNTFNLRNGSVPQSCTGGNTFDSGTVNLFNNYGSSSWYLATIAADDYNGEAHYRANSTGAIYPAYNSNCTYSKSIAVQPSSDSISFAAGPNGRVSFDGNTSGFFINNSLKTVSFKRITVNKPGTILSLYSHVLVTTGGDLTLTAGRLVTGSTGMVILEDESCTITNINASSTTYVDGPMRINVSSGSPVNLHFPIGRGFESRPVSLTLQHSTSTSYSYTAEMTAAAANALGWTNPASVYNTSLLRYWDITRTLTSNGAAEPVADLVSSPLPSIAIHYGLNDRANIPANLTICKNTYNALTAWTDIGASGATNSIGQVTSTSSPSLFSSFSRFTLGYYGIPPAPDAHDSSRCGTGSAAIRATPVYGESIDWYATATGGTVLASNTELFNTPVISSTTTFYAEARNTVGYVSATRTPVTAVIYQAPTVSNFSPSSGDLGTSVTITGTDFNNNVSAVTFGGVAALSFTVNSSTQITAVVASGASGAVAVTNDCGTGSKTGFIYNPLTVWTGAINTSWTNAGNWDDGVPTNIHSAVIPVVSNQPLIISNQTVRSITIQPGAVVDIAVGNSLHIRDSLTNNGDVIGGGSVVLSGASTQPVGGTGFYNNLTLNNSSGAVILGGAGNMVNITGRYIPTAGVLITNDNLTIKSSASENGAIAAGSASGNYISGKVILERYIPARRAWRLINFPVTSSAAPSLNAALQEGAGGNASSNPSPGYGTHITGGNIADGFDQNPSNNPSVKEWTGGAWAGIPSTNTAVGNQYPYFVFVRGSRANNLNAGISATPDNTTLRITGNIRQGNQSITIGSTGWQLTGNPFPAIINLDILAANNSSHINRNFVYWDPKLGGSNNVGGFVTASYNGAGYDFSPSPVSALSEYAQPFSGFYIDAVAAGTITVPETIKCNCGNGNVFRPAPAVSSSKLRINLRSMNTDGTTPVIDGSIVTFDERYSDDKDSYDASKLPNTLTENIAISTNSHTLAIERRKTIAENDTVFLHISNLRIKNYQFEILPENFDTTMSAYLEDSYTAERKPISLSSGGIFQFSIFNNPAVYAPNRFRIVFEKDRLAVVAKRNSKPVVASIKKRSITLLQNPVINNTIEVSMKDQPKGYYQLSISDKDGKEIATKQFFHDGTPAAQKITVAKQLPKSSLVLSIKGAGAGTTSFNILVQ
jgi:Ig-like domain CHU_C associated